MLNHNLDHIDKSIAISIGNTRESMTVSTPSLTQSQLGEKSDIIQITQANIHAKTRKNTSCMFDIEVIERTKSTNESPLSIIERLYQVIELYISLSDKNSDWAGGSFLTTCNARVIILWNTWGSVDTKRATNKKSERYT